MLMRRVLFLMVGVGILGFAACSNSSRPTNPSGETGNPVQSKAEVGSELYSVSDKDIPVSPSKASRRLVDPIVVLDCRITVGEKEEVPSQKDGVILFIGTEVKPGEQVKPEDLIELPDEYRKSLPEADQQKKYRKLETGMLVAGDQLMALLNDELARADWAIKQAKVKVAEADFDAANKTAAEAYQRWLTQKRLFKGEGNGLRRGTSLPATSEEDLRAAELLYWTKSYEAKSKNEQIRVSNLEMDQAKIAVKMHRIEAAISGEIKQIYKHKGESVKAQEPVFQVLNLGKLRVEGLVDSHYLGRLNDGKAVRSDLRVSLEVSQSQDPYKTLTGHLQPITSVAWGRTKTKLVIVSASEDGTIRIWDPLSRDRERVLDLQTTVGKAVACSSGKSGTNWCLCGTTDGIARVKDLDSADDTLRELKHKDGHRAPITCVAFSPDGAVCATGGDDRKICVWNPATGDLLFSWYAHKGAVTSLQFTPKSQLVTAGRDNTLRIWTLGKEGARLERTFDNRAGDVALLGVSPDGKRGLFDLGKELQILSLPKGENEGRLQNSSASANFSTFAHYSPDGSLLLTANGSEGYVQLWRAPGGPNERGYEFRKMAPGSPVTCAAFSPDSKYVVTGAQNRDLVVWKMPTQEEIDQEVDVPAELILAEPAIDNPTGQIRVWARPQNPKVTLLPNSIVTIVIDANQ
jgi:hypothetical protein